MNKSRLKQIEKAFKIHSLKGGSVPDAVPDKWFTAKEYQESNKIGHTNAQRQLDKLVELGYATKQNYRTLSRNGFLRTTIHYRLLAKK